MNAEQVRSLEECVRGAQSGELTFPQIVGRLAAMDVERYHADYSRSEITYYLANGDSHVAPAPHERHATGLEFSAAGVEAAVRQSQRNEHSYADFVRKTMDAGCVGYFVQITGRQVLYFGRRGECHIERFPSAPATP